MGIAVITGAGRGIGRAIALAAVSRGLAVAICDCDGRALQSVASEIAPHCAVNAVLDVSDFGALEDFANETARHGEISLVFANAGILRMGSLIDRGSRGDWRAMIDVNLVGTLNTIAAFVPILIAQQQQSRIVITGSEGSFDASPNVVVYSATKHALWALADGLHHDLEAADIDHVAVSLLVPGVISTSIARPAGTDQTKLLAEMDGFLTEFGSSPDEMARVAFDGIDRGHFYIFLRPEASRSLLDRVVNLIDGQPLRPRMPTISSVAQR